MDLDLSKNDLADTVCDKEGERKLGCRRMGADISALTLLVRSCEQHLVLLRPFGI